VEAHSPDHPLPTAVQSGLSRGPTITRLESSTTGRRLRSTALLPTPLHRLDKLSDALGGPQIWMKRDDCTGLAGGGNKARKLIWLMADASAQGADVVLTTGAPQSNHARQTAAAAAMSGLRCELILQRGVPNRTLDYERCGNVLLDHIFGARITFVDADADPAAVAAARAQELSAEGLRPYVIPAGGSNVTGALGYVDCAAEMASQFIDANITPNTIVHATGSGGTQAGLIYGMQLVDNNSSICGVSVGAERTEQVAKVEHLLIGLAEEHGVSPTPQQVIVDDTYIGAGYGQPTPACIAAVRTVARLEGVLLDPVYTGKAMAFLLDAIYRSPESLGQTVVFLHTGGAHALHAYPDDFTERD
jgi:L-cysteate sulfo-lyase